MIFFREFDHCETVDEKFTCFYQILNECISANVPLVNTQNRFTNRTVRPPKLIRRSDSRKKSAWRRYKRSRSQSDLKKYKSAAKNLNKLIHERAIKREAEIINSNNISAFYRYSNRKFNVNTAIGPLKSASGSLVCDSASKATIFQHNFSEYFTDDNGITPPSHSTTEHEITDIVFSPSLVAKAIKRLRTDSKCGPDHIPPLFIKHCSLWLVAPLAYLYQLSFANSYMPPIWLTSFVTPVFKKGDPTSASNYRPISLTCVFCKIMEHIIKEQVSTYLYDNKMISKQQHAFIKKHSTTTNLIETTRNWTIALNCRQITDIIFIDFQRAFDSIVHNKLLCKLTHFGISGALLKYIEVFLSNRTQRVVLENSSSHDICVKSGVIQGSVLGPLLFILFINDLDCLIGSHAILKLFADDAKLYSYFDVEIPAASHPSTYFDLQYVLNLIYEWSVKWQLIINIIKCSCMRVGLASLLRSVPSPQYFLNGIPLAINSSARDLGIIIDNVLSYNAHIHLIITRASQRLGVLFNGFLTRDMLTLRKAYITYIRPLLEYNCIVWSPTLKKHINAIEKIQRKFTKRIPSLSNMPYLDRLKTINLDSLELRRLRFDLIYYYKILHDLTPHDKNDFFSFHLPPTSLRSATPLLIRPTRASSVLYSSFQYRSIKVWNYIPDDIKTCNSLPKFKNLLKTIDLSSFLYGECYTNLSNFACFIDVKINNT